ncbi:MAG: autotransporter outer membrane beta-barrel domain-containing protein, partial [Pseudolabrys sp.]
YGGQSYDPNALYSPNGQYGSPPPQYGAPPQQEERGPLGYAQEYRPGYGPFGAEKGDPMTTGADLRLPRQPQYYEPQVQPAPQQKRLLPCSSDWATNMAFWTSGSVQFGSATSNGALEGSKFTTSGLTAGVDIRPTDALIVGLAIGYGADRSDVGINGSRSDSSSLSAALYACMRLFNPIFLDAALGYGTLDYNNRRFVTGEGTFAEGRRQGSYIYGAAKLSAELQRGRFKFSPYVLAEFNSTSLDGYSETGSTLSLLTYDSMKFNAVTGVVGLRGSIDIPMSFGTLTPNARIEYRSTSTSAFDQALYYTDLGSGSSSTFGQPVGVRNVGTGTLGLRARSVGGLGVEIEYSYAAGSDSYQSQTIRGAMRVPF